MPSLKDVRDRIVSVSSTQQITSAMKMVSAAKLRRATDAIIQMRPYANKLKEVLGNLSASLDSGTENIYASKREIKNVLLVVITSNRGLCGAFNSNVIKLATKLARVDYKDKKVSVIAIGKKAHDHFRRTEFGIHGTDMPRKLHELYDHLNFDHVAPVADVLMKEYTDKEFDKIILVYNQFKNASVQILTQEQLLPVEKIENKQAGKKENKTKDDYIFEPGQQEIVSELIPRSLKIQFYKALLDSHAAEHGARMTSMHKATDNANELKKQLKLQYNKARQAAITNEILEIVGGAEALNG